MQEFTKSAFDPASAFETDRTEFYADDSVWSHEFDDDPNWDAPPAGLEPTVITLMKDDPELDKFRNSCCGGHFQHHTSRCRKY
jgi:hypothetical protein